MAKDVLQKRAFAKGDVIFLEGDGGDCTYLVHAGQVELVKRTKGGTFERLAMLGPGQVFGELALLTDRPRAASARAVTECVLIAVERNQLDSKLERADPFVRALFRILANNLISVMDKKAALEASATQSDIDALGRGG